MPLIDEFITKHRLQSGFNDTAHHYYIPLAERVAMHHKSAKRSYFVGINGCQGSGKSTLADFLSEYLQRQHGLKVVILSLDDFYFDQQKRQQLASSIHPLLATRGVPGTHNSQLMDQVLSQLSQPNTVLKIPRFNKATDNPHPQTAWPQVSSPADIVIFEGWCWGVPAQSDAELAQPVNQLEQQQDPQGIWRRYVNQQLISHYLPLYQGMDYWVMFQAPSFANVFQWRLEQEQKLAAQSVGTANTGIMSEAQIADFIQYYQRLTEHGLREMPQYCHEVFRLNDQRQILEHQQNQSPVSY